MAGFKIRMLTLHAGNIGDDARVLVEELYTVLAEARDRIVGEIEVQVETVRITLPDPASGSEALARVKALEDLEGEDLIVSIGNVSSTMSSLEDVVVETARAGLFAAILLQKPTWQEARRISMVLHRLADEDPSLGVHIGINTLGTPLVTPYYPLSHSPQGRRLLTTALTYPNYLAEVYMKQGLEGLEEAVKRAGRIALRGLELAGIMVKAEPAGVDLSVAPWMEDSSLGLVELVAGVRMPQPGFSLGLAQVNGVLARAAGNTRAVGFNEVQLPVAEDLKMKARVSEGDTTALDLARLSGVCLAGLDLVVTPASIDGVAGLILEVAAYSRSKSKPLGVRLIPVEGVEPGDKVYLDRFGETPVIPIY
ncbi:MAG: DUF711 family protein [Desulfurococcales archaeon]|nr:DUF711 family protein [Desulfurococcales archaeon]MCE4604927.1 DUF711 family protein [Desulfurococcales archaeon]